MINVDLRQYGQDEEYKKFINDLLRNSERNDILQKRLEDYPMLKEQKCECYTCIYAPNKECGWYAACNNCIDGSNYWRKEERNTIFQNRLEDYPWKKEVSEGKMNALIRDKDGMDHIAKFWPMARTSDDEILNTSYPRLGIRDSIDVIETWEESNYIKEAWIDMTIDDDPEPVKRIPLRRTWKLGKSIVLKEESNGKQTKNG